MADEKGRREGEYDFALITVRHRLILGLVCLIFFAALANWLFWDSGVGPLNAKTIAGAAFLPVLIWTTALMSMIGAE